MNTRSRAAGKAAKGRSKQTPPTRRNAAKDKTRSKSPPLGQEIEVARLSRELNEALEHQAATSEVLEVIRKFSGDLEPVFATVLENATRVCVANFGVLTLCEGEDRFRVVAMCDVPPAYAELRRREPVISPALFVQMVMTKQAIQIRDMTELPAYKEKADPNIVSFVDMTGVRTNLSVPLLTDQRVIGIITVYRTEVRPFADKLMDLLKNFAAQAVIAIENARLLNELRQRTTDLTESLEQQIAASEVLKVISNSPSDLEPVFDAMLSNSTRHSVNLIALPTRLSSTCARSGRCAFAAVTISPPSAVNTRERSPSRPGCASQSTADHFHRMGRYPALVATAAAGSSS